MEHLFLLSLVLYNVLLIPPYMKRFLILSLLLISFLSVSAQNDTIIKKFGDVSPEDFVPTELEKIGGYKAVILQHQRYVHFDLFPYETAYLASTPYKWYLRLANTYLIRYKALEDNFFEDNKFVIPFSGRYHYDIVPIIKANVYSCVNNKVSTTKIKYKNIKTINRDSINSRIEISFPNIKKGDIVELTYTVASFNFLNPEKCHFHHEFPCKISQVIIEHAPEELRYDWVVTGDNTPISHHLKQKIVVLYGDVTHVRSNPLKGATPNISGERFYADQHFYTANNTLPVDTVLNFMPQPNYYDAQILIRPKRFTRQISSAILMYYYAQPGARYKTLHEVSSSGSSGYIKFESNNWNRFHKRQRQNPEFWPPLVKAMPLTGKLAEIYDKSDAVDSLTLVKQIYHYVTSNIKWDSTLSNAISHTPEEVLQRGRGNSAEINGTLVSLLRRAGYHALPVYSATRDFGMVDSNYVNTWQYNNILAYVDFYMDDGFYSYVMDATSPYRDFNVLNTQNINNLYLVMDLENHFFVSVPHDYADTLELTAKIDGNTCNINRKASGIFVDEQHYKDTTLAFNGSDLKSAFKILMGDNPFPESDRTVPVDFIVPRHYTYRVKTNSLTANDFVPFDLLSAGDHLKAHTSIGNEDGYTVYQIDVDITMPFFDVPLYYGVKQFFDMVYSAAE